MPSKNYPKDIFEGIDINLCMAENAVKDLRRRKGGFFPTYQKSNLPQNLVDAQGFFTEEGQFCIQLEGTLYCMPGAPKAVGPPIFSADTEKMVPWNAFSLSMWEIHIAESGGLERAIAASDNYHCVSPVWGTDLNRIIYQEMATRTVGHPTGYTTKLCVINKDGSGRTVIHDTGVEHISSGTNNYYYNYCMSPDGQKVAFINADQGLQCVFTDGSGDCGGGTLSANVYGNPQWSHDSNFIYISDYDSPAGTIGIAQIHYTGSVEFAVYEDANFDYFWINNAGTKFATPWYPGGSFFNGGFAVIDKTTGTTDYAWSKTDLPWPSPETPTETFWAPDDSFLIITQQQQSITPNFGSYGVAVRTTPDLSDWMVYEWPDNASDRGIVNWSLGLAGGQMKLLGAAHNEDVYGDGSFYDGFGIYKWDIATGAQEGWYDISSWGDGDPGTVWSRYSMGGLPTCTSFYGCQIWDV